MAEVNSFFINPKTKKGGTELKDQIFEAISEFVNKQSCNRSKLVKGFVYIHIVRNLTGI